MRSGRELCTVCRKRATNSRSGVCGDCRAASVYTGLKLPPRDCHSMASEDQIKKLIARAEQELPLAIDRWSFEGPRRMTSNGHHYHG